MEAKELARERRRASRLERLRTKSPRCPCCGETDDRCFELHHLTGKQLDQDFSLPICANCHKKLTEMQKDHPKMSKNKDLTLAKIGEFVIGLADMLVLIIDKLYQFGQELIDRANREGDVLMGGTK